MDDGANRIWSHSWLAPIGDTGSGAENGVNFEIFKNHSGALEGVIYQPTGPKFIYMVEVRVLHNPA